MFLLVVLVLFLVEGVVLYIGVYPVFFKVFIILLAAVSRIGGDGFDLAEDFLSVTLLKIFQMLLQSSGVVGILVDGIV